MSGVARGEKQNPFRVRSTHNKKWKRKEELALIDFIKKNSNFEKPCARIYYTKFIFESGIDVDWKLVRCKVRNMRVSYRRAKEYEIGQVESNNYNIDELRIKIIKMCWFADEFDALFPNLMDNGIDKHFDPIFDDEFSKDESYCNEDKRSENIKVNFSPEEESTASSLSKSINDDLITVQKNMLNIKKEKQDEDTIIKHQEPDKATDKSNCEKDTSLKELEVEAEKTPFRNRTNPIRKWRRNEEVALISYLKENRDFEHPNARIYYTQFLVERGIDAGWKNVRSKVRNMRVTYRKAKEHEIKEVDSNNCNIRVLRSQILKLCWFVDDFDDLFPNDMDNYACLQLYQNPDLNSTDDFSRNEPFNNVNNSSKNLKRKSLFEDDSTCSSLSNSVDESIFTVQNNFLNLKKQKRDEDKSLKQQELELAKEKLNFEKEKFRQEIRLKEKEIENEERLKVMEFQMKERIALKKLEIEEMQALRSTQKPENSYNNIYHNLT